MMPMGKRKPDVLETLMSGSMDDEAMEPEEGMGDESDVTVIATEDDDEPMEAEEGTPEAAFAKLRSGLDELEMMFRKG
jgi:hypothetical protein